MSKLKEIFVKAKSHLWEATKDTFYPRKLRRIYNRNRYNTKMYYPFNPGFTNERTEKNNERVDLDYRTPFKDAHRE